MMKKEDKAKEELEVKKDCVFFQKSGCYALSEFVCKSKKCTFYSRNQRY